MKKRNESRQPSRRPGKWLCLHFPRLGLDVFTRSFAQDDLEVPIVLLQKQRVALVNEKAAEAGIEVGSTMNSAYSLESHIRCMERDQEKEGDAIHNLASWCYQFTPSVALFPPNSLLLEISGSMTLFGGWRELRRSILDGIAELGYRCHSGSSSTPMAALLKAKAINDAAVSHDAPGNQTVEDIPIRFLEGEPKIIDSLHSMGLARTGDLLRLPRGEITRRFGHAFSDYLQRLTGEKDDPHDFLAPPTEFASEICFLTDITNTQSLLFPMKRLLSELTGFLRGRQLAIEEFIWELKHRSRSEPERIDIRLAAADNNEQMFLSLTKIHLENFHAMPEVDTLALKALHFSPLQIESASLFVHLEDKASTTKPSDLLSLLQARLGTTCCFGIDIDDDHRPERAWNRVPPLDARDAEVGISGPRPLYFVNPARRLDTLDGKPFLNGVLTLLQGPERIDFGWWDQQTMAENARDYYVARRATGSLLWIFHCRKGWYLQGVFS